MNESIFRNKSLSKIQSPEVLDEYIKVSDPGVWLLLASVIILLAGACIWGIFGHIDSTVSANVCVENGKAICYVNENDINMVKAGMTVKFDGQEMLIESIGEKADNRFGCSLTEETSLPDGYYNGTVVVERYKPLSFVFN